MSYQVIFKTRVEFPPAMKQRQLRIQKATSLPFPPYDLPRGYPIYVDDLIGTRRVQEQRYYLEDDMFVIDLQPELRISEHEAAQTFLDRFTKSDWSTPNSEKGEVL